MAPTAATWFSVRCVFRIFDEARSVDGGAYEERITLWQANSSDEAIALAEAEAAEYVEGANIEFAGLAQSFQLFDPPASGSEVFSLIRDSDLQPKDYLDRFFDTGAERQREN